MASKLPPLNALRVFEAAARLLSFTRAADELFVTQAAVSHQVKALEEFIGIKLFMRKNRSLFLTEEGQSYYLDIKDVFNLIKESTEKLLARGEKGAITVSVQASFAIQWLVPRLKAFSLLHPDIDVRIKAVDQPDNLLTEDIDIAIYYGRGDWGDVHAVKLHQEYLIPVCSPLIFSSGKPLKRIEDLANHSLLHYKSREDWKRWFKKVGLKGVDVNNGPIFSHSAMVVQAAIHGQGVALAHSAFAKPDIDSGRLICPFNEILVSKNSHYIVCREHQLELGKISAFRDWVLNTVAQEQEEDLYDND